MKKEELVKLVSLVNCSTYRGHDGDGYLRCDIKYKGKKVAEMHEDAWGGGYVYKELDSKLFSELQSAFKGFPQIDFENHKMDDDLDFLVEDLFRAWERKKDEKKGFLIETNWGYEIYSYSVQLPTLIKKYRNGLEHIQKGYDEHKAKGETILNTEYLESIGVKL